MKTLKLITFLALLNQITFSQTLPPPPPPPASGQVNKADSLFNEGNMREAVAEYKKMYIKNRGDGRTVYNYACALSRNEADCNQYALMFDRLRMNQNLPQRFGTHHYLDPAKGKTDELYPLEDETRVDEWRKEIGLEPLKDYLLRSNIKYEPSDRSK